MGFTLGKSGIRIAVRIAAIGALLSCASFAQAGYTDINAPSGGELGHADILSGIYGGSFSASGVDFSNGSITATRMHDFDDGGGFSNALDLLGGNIGSANDQIWLDGIATMGARARYASQNQIFGYYQGSDDPTTGFTSGPLVSIDSNPFLGSGASYGPTNISGEWRWGRTGDINSHSSLDADNADGLDHLVTYMITGEGLTALGYDANAVVWLLFWEDSDGTNSDRDFNDFVVEISAIAIPLPAPLALASMGLIGVLLGRKKLRKQLG